LEVETDPVFNAWDKDYDDLINLPDLSVLATTEALADSVALLRAEAFSGDMGNEKISNLADPSENQDAATKAYVDLLETKILALESMLLDGGLYNVKDADGNVYRTVKIGEQVWMAENLRTTKFKGGSSIPIVTNGASWGGLSTSAYCWYNNDMSSYADTLGAIYNGYAALTDSICPSGWHVPSNTEWAELIDFVGGSAVAGGKLKEAGTKTWNSPNTGATDEYNFTAVAGGARSFSGTFSLIGTDGDYWSSTPTSSSNYYIKLNHDNTSTDNFSYDQKSGKSIRCVRD
jgi:uncharacterized protein (TIGR02145 family)